MIGTPSLGRQDFWRNKGRIDHVRFTEPPQAEKERLNFAAECRLLAAAGATLGSLSNRFTLIALTNAWLLVWEAEFHPGNADLVFGDQEEMGFGARVATAIFAEQRDRFERSEAARAFRDGLRRKGGGISSGETEL